MKLPSLSHMHAPRRADGRRPHAFSASGDILIGVGLIAIMVLLTQLVSMATDVLGKLFGA